MSEVERYDWDGFPADYGGVCLFTDHEAAIKAEREKSGRLVEAAKIGLAVLKSDYVGRGGKDLSGGQIAEIEAALRPFEEKNG